MNKKNPGQIKRLFDSEAIELRQFFWDARAGVSGTSHPKRHVTTLSELVFLNAYVSFETFVSDLFLAYVNKDATVFQNSQEKRIRHLVKEDLGNWYKDRVTLTRERSLNADTVETLLDPNGYNVTFGSAEEMKRLAGKWLAPGYRRKIFTLSNDDFLFIDCCKTIRNVIAHKSKRSLDIMNQQLKTIPSGSTIDFVRRTSNDVKTVGVFLKSNGSTQPRVVECLERLRAIARDM